MSPEPPPDTPTLTAANTGVFFGFVWQKTATSISRGGVHRGSWNPKRPWMAADATSVRDDWRERRGQVPDARRPVRSPGCWLLARNQTAEEVAEPADKPGSVVDSHSSRRSVTATLEQPTRTRRGPRHEVPIWPCSRWGLPCRPVTRLAVRSYRTISPLPRPSCDAVRRYLSVALSVGSRRPGVTWHRALWSPDFPRHPPPPKGKWMTRLPGRLRRGRFYRVAVLLQRSKMNAGPARWSSEPRLADPLPKPDLKI